MLALLTLGWGAPCAVAQQDFLQGIDGFQVPSFGDEGAEADPVTVSAQFVPKTSDRPAVLMVSADVAPGWHVYSLEQPPRGPQRTTLRVDPSPDYRLTGPFAAHPLPERRIDTAVFKGVEIQEHAGRVTWYAPVELAAGVDPADVTISGSVSLQACAESCLPLKLDFAARQGSGVPIGPLATGESPRGLPPRQAAPTPNGGPVAVDEAGAPAVGSSLALTLGFALLGGLVLNFMPCVLPVIGLKVLSFVEQSGNDRGRLVTLNLSYTAGMLTVFMLLALLASLAQLGLSSQSFAWGQLNTLLGYKIGITVLVFAMALSFMGVWEIPIPGFAGSGAAVDLAAKEGVPGAFYKGVFTTILATPCSGPFLGPVFGATLSQPAGVTFLIFACIGLGMASPYLLISLFPALLYRLPKPGAWMETFKQLLGFLLMATVVYFLSWFSERHYVAILSLLVGVAFACWWIGRTPLTASTRTRRTAWLGGIATAVAVGVFSFHQLTPREHLLPWQPYSPEALAAAQAQGKTVLVEFTAAWCPNCIWNMRNAIDTPQTADVVASNDVVTLLADWTDNNEAIGQAVRALGSKSIPLLAIYPAGDPGKVIKLSDVITQQELLEALGRAGATRGNPVAARLPEVELGTPGEPTRAASAAVMR